MSRGAQKTKRTDASREDGDLGIPAARHENPALQPSTKPDSGGGPAEVRSVARAMQILTAFDDQRPVWSVSELARVIGLPKTTVLRLVATLESAGLLWTRPDGLVVVSARLLSWVRSVEKAWEVPPTVHAEMQALAHRFSESCNLYVRLGMARICIAQSLGPQTVKTVVRVGDDLPLWGGASGLILLADEPRSVIEQVESQHPAKPGVDSLVERVTAAKAAGYAATHGEREIGASGVAVPVRGTDGKVRAALSFGGPTGRFTEDRIPAMVEGLRAAAARLPAAGLENTIPFLAAPTRRPAGGQGG